MKRKTQTGYLMLADISGYTPFVAQTEIEHAGIALALLLETIVEKLSSLLTISKLEGIRDLLRTDVNLIHRLSRYHVSESTGWKAHVLFTDPVLERMEVSRDNLFKRSETYEHLGEVNIYCLDMHTRYEAMKAS
jgi:hypothetical protein